MPNTASAVKALVKKRSKLREETIKDAIIRIAGNSQDGIQSVGGVLARLAGRSAQEVMTYMSIPSTIAGGPSIFQVRIGSGEVYSAGDEADFLIAFYQHSYDDHIEQLRDGGVLIYDTDHVKPDISDKRIVYVGIPITGLINRGCWWHVERQRQKHICSRIDCQYIYPECGKAPCDLSGTLGEQR